MFLTVPECFLITFKKNTKFKIKRKYTVAESDD